MKGPLWGRSQRSQRGAVLAIVLLFVFLLAASVATLQRRAFLDVSAVRHRDAAREAESLARGGLRLAEVLLLADLRQKQQNGGAGLGATGITHLGDLWARAAQVELLEALGEDADRSLRIEIDDLRGRFPLNAGAVPPVATEEPIPSDPSDAAEDRDEDGGDRDEAAAPPPAPTAAEGGGDDEIAELWRSLLTAVIEDMPGTAEKKRYDPAALADRLLDWTDPDDTGRDGAAEAEAYAELDPPARPPPNRPLLSIDELRRIEGFDAPLIEALRPYVTVYPYVAELGINLNTAPPWVLGQVLLTDATSSDIRAGGLDFARRAVAAREQAPLCPGGNETCTPLSKLLANDRSLPLHVLHSDIFAVRVHARVGSVQRTLVSVLDRRNAPRLKRLAWRMD